jgi:hypothetical protein
LLLNSDGRELDEGGWIIEIAEHLRSKAAATVNACNFVIGTRANYR